MTSVPIATRSGDALLTMFREQNMVEHVNRQFKGPIAVRPVHFHSPHPIEAFVFLLMIASMTYFVPAGLDLQDSRRSQAATLLPNYPASG